MSWGEREDVGKTDDGDRIVRDENGDDWKISHESYGGTPEANERATDEEVEQAENNGR